MRLVLDTGALIALERNDRAMWQRLKLALQAREAPVSHGGIVGQVWRGRGARQALLARVLDVIDVRSLDAVLGRAAGELLARARQHDVIDAALVLLANDGDRVITSDPQDLALLARVADLDVEILTP
jgi:predicted nucleic acid-binding protein